MCYITICNSGTHVRTLRPDHVKVTPSVRINPAEAALVEIFQPDSLQVAKANQEPSPKATAHGKRLNVNGGSLPGPVPCHTISRDTRMLWKVSVTYSRIIPHAPQETMKFHFVLPLFRDAADFLPSVGLTP